MATLKHIPSNSEATKSISSLNEYIADGHGNEVLVRTNRYINDGHGLVTTLRGYNCPADPDLAAEVMQDLLTQYEYNLGGRKVRGTNGTKVPVTKEHLILSFHKDDDVSPKEGHQIFGELISRTKLQNFPVFSGDHNNTDEFHLHGCAGVIDITGSRKLCLNKRLLNELRRELDYICVEHGLSIVENPDLFADAQYREWFKQVKSEGKITIHPPLTTEEKRKRREDRMNESSTEDAPPMTKENRGTHFYCLPHLFDPTTVHSDIKQPLYIYALDENNKRRAPLYLAFELEAQWCNRCLEQLVTKDFIGKKKLTHRLKSTRDSAKRNIDHLKKLDITTSHDLDRHMKCVGKDLSECRKYRDELDINLVAYEDDETKEKLKARKEKTLKREAALRQEYRNLAKVKRMYISLMDPDKWTVFTESLMERVASCMTENDRLGGLMHWHYHDIGQLIGLPPAKVDKIIEDAKAKEPYTVLEQWIEVRGTTTIQFTRTAWELSSVYVSIKDMYAERAELRQIWRDLLWAWSTIDLADAFLLPLIILAISLTALAEHQAEKRIAETRQLIEEIKWHNQNSMKQLQVAKSKCALLIAYGDYTAALDAWDEFERTCTEIMERTTNLKIREKLVPPPRPDPDLDKYIHPEDQVPYDFKSAVDEYEQKMQKVRTELRQMLDQRRTEEAQLAERPNLWNKPTPVPESVPTPPPDAIPDPTPNPEPILDASPVSEVEPELVPEPEKKQEPNPRSFVDILKSANERAGQQTSSPTNRESKIFKGKEQGR